MATSEFVKRKLAMAFYRFDRDKDGVVGEEDFVLLGQEVARLRGLELGNADADSIIEAHCGWWHAYFKGGDSDGDGHVTLEEYGCLRRGVGRQRSRRSPPRHRRERTGL